jgi:hypothetical protein
MARRHQLLRKQDSKSRIGMIMFKFRSSIKDQRIFISSPINLVVQSVLIPVPHTEDKPLEFPAEVIPTTNVQ